MESKRKRPDLAERNRQNAKHGMWQSKTYMVWGNMKDRCYNPNSCEWHNYGKRGIAVCDEWKHSFEAFLSDMGEAPAGYHIDRIDNNGNYEKSNCRWVTPLVNANNKRTCVFVTYNEKTQSIADWARETGLERKTLERRIRVGWPIAKALTTPSLIKRRS